MFCLPLFPQREPITHYAHETASVKDWVNLMYYNLWYAFFAKPESWVHSRAGRWRLKEGYCHKIRQRHEGSLILSKVPGLEILRYRLAKKFIHVCCSILWKASKELLGHFFSDPVFWTKPQGTHSFHPLRNQKRFWVATSSVLLPGVLLWSLWVLQEKRNFISRGDF